MDTNIKIQMTPNTQMTTNTQIKKNNKCEAQNCTKKLKLTDLVCRCDKLFCSEHRMPEVHKCSFSYKEYGRTILALKLIKCNGQKIIKI